MAYYVGLGIYTVVALTVGGSKVLDIKLALQCEPRATKTWFTAGSILPNKEHVDADVRELREEIGLTLTSDNLTTES
jgi:8-oxo-dGTP pyrophosphatase MutT (NUDIX family)